MAVVAWIVGLILIVGFGMSGVMKIVGQSTAVEMAEKLGFSNLRQAIGGLELLGAIGVFIGLVTEGRTVEPIGVFAAVGLILTMIGAVVYHVRGGDGPKDSAPAVVMAVLAVLYVIAIGTR